MVVFMAVYVVSLHIVYVYLLIVVVLVVCNSIHSTITNFIINHSLSLPHYHSFSLAVLDHFLIFIQKYLQFGSRLFDFLSFILIVQVHMCCCLAPIQIPYCWRLIFNRKDIRLFGSLSVCLPACHFVLYLKADMRHRLRVFKCLFYDQ